MSMRQLVISRSITNRESDGISRYLQDINKVERISPAEEVELALRIQKGDRAAINILTRANLRFVVSVAKQYQGHGLSLSDLVNEGNIGLMEAAGRFDPSKGFKFISFAVWWIRQHMPQAIAANGRAIRLPINKVALTNRAMKMAARLEQHLERNPSADEIAEAMEVDPSELHHAMGHKQSMVSLDSPLNEDEDTNWFDVLENKEAIRSDRHLVHQDSLRVEINRLLRSLNERQKEVVCLYFGIGTEQPIGLEEIATRYDLTTERVRQIKDKALEKLRQSGGSGILRSFLD